MGISTVSSTQRSMFRSTDCRAYLTSPQVHGNASAENTNNNAARCLYAFAAPEKIKIYPGATKPLIRPTRHDPEIHGIDGLGGVEGLPPGTHESVQERLRHPGRPAKAVDAIARAVEETWKNGSGDRVAIISSGPMTNIALFVSIYPELLEGIGRKFCEACVREIN